MYKRIVNTYDLINLLLCTVKALEEISVNFQLFLLT